MQVYGRSFPNEAFYLLAVEAGVGGACDDVLAGIAVTREIKAKFEFESKP